MIKLLLTTIALLTALPVGASAQSFTVLPVERDSRVSSAERNAAFTAVQSARVLGPSAHFEPVGVLQERLSEAEQALAECLEVDCAARLATQAGLDAVLVVAVWPDDAGRAASVAVTLVEPSGATWEADAEVSEGGVSQAATSALVAATRRRSLGGGVELRVGSAPEGALVLVDGTEVGVTPFVGAFEVGTHTVEVRLRGESETREVILEDDTVSVEVALGLDVSEGSSGSGEQAPSVWNWVVGGGLVGLGVGALISPLVTAAQSGQCKEEDPSGGCREQVSFGGRSTALLILGAVGIAAGVTVLALQPFQVRVETDGTGARLGLSGRF